VHSGFKAGHIDEPELVAVFIPALVVLLSPAAERTESPLTEHEVFEIRNDRVCVAMPVKEAVALGEKRGYKDMDPERVRKQWQQASTRIEEG